MGEGDGAMRIWSIANQKGGVGKTTTAVTLGYLLSAQGRRVLLVDLDPHGSMSAYFGYDPDEMDDSVYRLFQRGSGSAKVPLASLLAPLPHSRLTLLPASTSLVTLDRQLAGVDGMGLVLKRALEQLHGKFDDVMVDCPPMFGILMLNALAACEKLLIPVQTEFLALKGLDRMMNSLRMVGQSLHRDLPYLVLPTMFDQRTRASMDSLAQLRKDFPRNIWPDVIPVDTKFRDASLVGKPLPLMARDTHGALAYERLVDYLQPSRMMGLAEGSA